MQRLEVSGAVRLIYRSLGVKGLKYGPYGPLLSSTPGICLWPISVANFMFLHPTVR